MLNIKSLFTKILNNILLKSGGTMSTTLRNSDGAYLMGSRIANSQTIPNLFNELYDKETYAFGSVYISTAYTSSTDGITIATGWYNYFYFNSTDDVHMYLCGMTINNIYYYLWTDDLSTFRIYKWQTTEPSVATPITAGTTTNYTTYGNNTSLCSYRKYGRLVCLTLIVNCISAARWPSTYFASVGSDAYPYSGTEVAGTLCDASGHSSMCIAINSSGQIKGSGGVNGKQYVGNVYYMASTD